MKHVSKFRARVTALALATLLFSLFTLFNPGNLNKVAFAQEGLGESAIAEQLVYGPQVPKDSDLVMYGPQLPPEKPDLSVSVLSKAKSLMGLPYRFGGNNPGESMDCSSYVQLVFKEAGLELPRVTYDQFKQGQPIGVEQLQPGDLLFFSTNGSGPSHIGIYAGNGEFIHESPPGVQVTRLDNPSYQKHFVGARRVLN
ncbi:MAG TPA: C40 family peptidase [Candidatus Deferrimicrobium sp.]|nr:C40 family peptidase [Candidatus Deferrimicrobium sp.]